MRRQRIFVGLGTAIVMTTSLTVAPSATAAAAQAATQVPSQIFAQTPSAHLSTPQAAPSDKDRPGKNKQSAGSSKASGKKAAKKAAQKAAAKKAAAKKAGSKKAAAKKAGSKKAVSKKAAAQQSAKRAAAKKAAAKRAAAKRAAAKRAAAAQRIAYKRAKARAKTIKAPRMVQGRICPTRNFSYGDGWGADRGRRNHAGMDMSGRRGTPLFAIESGYINRTKRQSNGAMQIVMKGKSGSKYYYGHMQHVFVRGGQSVRAGQVIGTMGDSGSPGAVHLHFEYWKSGRESAAVNPASLLRTICRAAQ
jgi:murein DD-endopeptidase MepM/ murein hydrolase activator NlpD